MKITFIGTSGGFLGAEKSFPAILINDDLLLDCGEGTTQKLIQLNSIKNINVICLTHLHNDHFMGLFSLLWYYWLNNRTEDLVIIGPPKTKKTIEKILELINTPESMDSFSIHFKELRDSNEIQTFEETYKIKCLKMPHSIISFAYRVDKGNKFICYSGDTKPNKNLILLSENCDLLIHESTFLDRYEELAHKLYHSTPSDAAEIAMESNCKKLVLFHIPPSFSKHTAKFKKQAEKIFKKKVLIAEDLMELNI